MISEQEFKELKKKVAQATQTRDRSMGQLDGIMERLKTEYKCKDLEHAERVTKQLTKKVMRQEKEYKAAAAAFEEEWAQYADQ